MPIEIWVGAGLRDCRLSAIMVGEPAPTEPSGHGTAVCSIATAPTVLDCRGHWGRNYLFSQALWRE